MARHSAKFGYQEGDHGVRFTAVDLGLSGACLSGREIDQQRDRLKAELEGVAVRMKAALRKPPVVLPRVD